MANISIYIPVTNAPLTIVMKWNQSICSSTEVEHRRIWHRDKTELIPMQKNHNLCMNHCAKRNKPGSERQTPCFLSYVESRFVCVCVVCVMHGCR